MTQLLIRGSLLVLLLIAGWATIAELRLLHGRFLIDQAEDDGRACEAYAALEQANWPLLPTGRMKELQAQLMLARAARPPECEPAASSASELLAGAEASRPLWPTPSILRAFALLLEGSVDEAFTDSYARAQQLGPWEPGVQRVSLRLLMVAWPRLDESVRQNAAASLAQRMLASRVHGQGAWLESMISRQSNGDELCQAALDAGVAIDCS